MRRDAVSVSSISKSLSCPLACSAKVVDAVDKYLQHHCSLNEVEQKASSAGVLIQKDRVISVWIKTATKTLGEYQKSGNSLHQLKPSGRKELDASSALEYLDGLERLVRILKLCFKIKGLHEPMEKGGSLDLDRARLNLIRKLIGLDMVSFSLLSTMLILAACSRCRARAITNTFADLQWGKWSIIRIRR